MSSISIPTMNGASFRSLSLSSARMKANACSFSNAALLKKRGGKSFARSRSTSSSRTPRHHHRHRSQSRGLCFGRGRGGRGEDDER